MFSKSISISLDAKPATTVQLEIVTEKSINIQLSSSVDLFFLYTLAIREDEFLNLKSSQNLLIDYNAFPEKLIELLKASFSVHLETGPKPMLKIVETNSFKHITHIELALVKASDAQLQKYLAGLVENLVVNHEKLKQSSCQDISHLQTNELDMQQSIKELTTKIDTLKADSSDLKVKHSLEFSKQKEEMMLGNEEAKRINELEKRQSERRHEEEQLTVAQTSFTHQTNHSNSQQDLIVQNAKQIEQLSQDLATVRYDNDKLQQSTRSSDKHIYELELQAQKYREGMERSERKCSEKDEAARRVGSLLEGKNNGFAALEERVRDYRLAIDTLEDKVKLGEEEIKKANSIIQKLQADQKSSKAKIKLKNEVTLQQEKLLDEKTHSMDLQQKDFNQAQEALVQKQEALAQCRENLEETTKKLNESKHIIEDNNHVIEWLHKQLNEGALAIDFEKYANHNVAVENRPPLDFGKFINNEGGTAVKSVTPKLYSSSRPPTAMQKSPVRVRQQSPVHHPHHSKISASNMATGASHFSANGFSGSGGINRAGAVRTERVVGGDGVGKSNYF